MYLKKFLSLCLMLIILGNLSACEDNWAAHNATDWKQCLKDFLTNNFPSLFDEATIKKNEELFDKWRVDPDYIPDPSDIPVDALDIDGKWHNEWYYYPMLLPYEYKFYDLDNDGIPELFMDYPTQVAEGRYKNIYKLYGSTYEKIETGEYLNGGYMEEDILYKNGQNKTVLIRYNNPDGAEAIRFLDIQDKKIIYSDYADLNGNIYDDLLFSSLYRFDNEMYDKISSELELALLPEFDCLDVINSIKEHESNKPASSEITEDQAMEIVKNYCENPNTAPDNSTGPDFPLHYLYAGIVWHDNIQYHAVRLEWLVDNNHLSYLSHYFVSLDGSKIYEGYIDNNTGEAMFY